MMEKCQGCYSNYRSHASSKALQFSQITTIRQMFIIITRYFEWNSLTSFNFNPRKDSITCGPPDVQTTLPIWTFQVQESQTSIHSKVNDPTVCECVFVSSQNIFSCPGWYECQNPKSNNLEAFALGTGALEDGPKSLQLWSVNITGQLLAMRYRLNRLC